MRKLEAQMQAACVRWFRYQYPEIIIYAIANGGSRNIVEAKNLKLQGVLAGVPDLFIAHPNRQYSGLFLEAKIGKNKPTERQKEVIERIKNAGYKVEIFYSFDEFVKLVNNYLCHE